jgi:YD repeat-containing protein
VHRLTARDGQLSASDDIVVTVTSPAPNAAPIVTCGIPINGRLLSTTDAADKSITYTHEIGIRKETVVSRTGDVSTFEYDVRGNVTKETDAEGGITTRTFDAHDNMLTKKDPNGHTGPIPTTRTTWRRR